MRRRLALTTAAVAVMIVAAFLVPLALLVRSIAEDRALAAADRGAATLAPVIAAVDDETAVTQVVDATNASDIGAVTVFLSDGTILGTPGVVDANVDLARTGRSFSTPVAGGIQVLVPVLGADGQTDVVRVFVEDSRLHDGVVPAWIVLGGLGVALVLVAVIVADRLGRSIVNPMNDLARTAERLGKGELTARVEPSGPPEVAEVGQTLNELAGRIGELLDAERESIANLSHRLRTPMTGLRLDIDGLRDLDERSRMTDDVEALTAAIDRVIRDARNRVQDPQRSQADLALIARDRVAFWAALADDQGRAYHTDIPDLPCPVEVAPDDLEAAIDALLNNVFAHTGDRDSFMVIVTPRRAGGGVLVVEDEGPGVADEGAAATRGVSAAGSTGLGLDIARTTAEASGGRLEVTRASAGGTRVTMELGQPRPL
jgi:signal transduction histidine kinase